MRHVLKVHREIIPGREMDFLVLGRLEAMRIVPEAPHVVISITTPDDPQARLADSMTRYCNSLSDTRRAIRYNSF